MSLIAELKRRNVFRVGVAYVVSAWVIVEASSLVLDIFGSSELIKQIIVALLALGLPFALLFAWRHPIEGGSSESNRVNGDRKRPQGSRCQAIADVDDNILVGAEIAGAKASRYWRSKRRPTAMRGA